MKLIIQTTVFDKSGQHLDTTIQNSYINITILNIIYSEYVIVV